MPTRDTFLSETPLNGVAFLKGRRGTHGQLKLAYISESVTCVGCRRVIHFFKKHPLTGCDGRRGGTVDTGDLKSPPRFGGMSSSLIAGNKL